MSSTWKGNLLAAIAVLMSGCASVNFPAALQTTNQDARDFTQGQLELRDTPASTQALDDGIAKLLGKPLSQHEAVRLALLASPSLQALLAQSWEQSASAAQSARIANPALTLERIRSADELEIGRVLSFGLLDVLTWPLRYRKAQDLLAQQQIRLTSTVVEQVTLVRQTWVRAVAAQQSVVYAKQVLQAASAGAELARRMESVGNFSKLQRARQQAFYADAATQLALAQHAATSSREELVRQLGLNDAQALKLRLPERLPDLPKQPILPEQAGRVATKGRLDIQLAKSEYDMAAKAQGLNAITSFTDIELGLRRDTVFDQHAGTSTSVRGVEVQIRLPLFDWGGQQRSAMNARSLSAANRLEAVLRSAGSHLRDGYSAYRTAYDVARHYQDEVVPLRKAILEENVLRYNGMLIGVFELLADSRDQVRTVIAAIAAEQQFWLADAALQAAMIGKPQQIRLEVGMSSEGGGNGGH
jgi:outer membrane protein TolC